MYDYFECKKEILFFFSITRMSHLKIVTRCKSVTLYGVFLRVPFFRHSFRHTLLSVTLPVQLLWFNWNCLNSTREKHCHCLLFFSSFTDGHDESAKNNFDLVEISHTRTRLASLKWMLCKFLDFIPHWTFLSSLYNY